MQVEVPAPQTLVGFINQIFDKALAETTFCELYSSLCEYVATRLPRFPDPNGDREVSFKRVLLNKCQEEFESGEAAMKAVAEQDERNKAESDKGSKQGEAGKTEGKEEEEEEKEEGEISNMSEEMKRKVRAVCISVYMSC
jgi:translation initiation factor 4G